MEVPGKLSSDGESERAEKFYEQALLLVDCCKIPEAIKLLEKACQLKPECEIYQETLAFIQMSTQGYSDGVDNEQKGSSYASVTRPKPSFGKGKEKSSSTEWNVKKARGKVPDFSSNYCSHFDEQATINNPWTSFVNRSYRKKTTKSSPIDGLTEIDLPQMSEDMLHYSRSQSPKQNYKDQEFDDVGRVISSSLETPISSQEAMCADGSSFDLKQENHVDDSVDDFSHKCGEYPEGFYSVSDNHDEYLDSRFLDELCAARETAVDDWAEYYDMLHSGLKEEAPCTPSDFSNQGVSTPSEYSDSFDEIDKIENVKQRNHFGADKSGSDKPESKSSSNVCSKCGHLRESGSPPSNPTKSRIHFVNGTCISSSSSSTGICTCNRKNPIKGLSEGQSTKSPLSASQQEFYRNLQNYFGGGKVKSTKTGTKAKKDSSLGDLHANSTTNCNSSTSTDEPPKDRSSQNFTESKEFSAKDSKQNDNFASKEHFTNKVEGLGASFSEDGMRKDKKFFGEERFQQTSYKGRQRDDDKVDAETKTSITTEHVKNSKERNSQRTDSNRRPRSKVSVKSRASHRRKSVDAPETTTASDEHVKERSSYKHKTERPAQSEVNFSKLASGLYCTGVAVLSKCGQATKSIFYYVLLLLVLLFGFFIYCVWFAGCWACRKVLLYIPVNRWLPEWRNKLSSLFEWLRKRRERRKTSPVGQTYDLPKNGDAALMHMLQNKDKDPYSVLGVPRDATDDDIRKQYRKLAVLIHPDKNTHPQADEAFKTLANAFDILSDPEKRSNYDAEAAWKMRAEERKERYGQTSPEQFFADLGKKMQEMQNYLHCNVCDGKHRRYSTDRFILTARFCSRCNTRHAAKEGDLWAESSFFGLKLHFYACMEGEVFDVTEWAACQGIGRVEANPHSVHLKLKTRQTQHGGFSSRSDERDFENFMRAFFGQFGPEEDRFHGTNKQRKRKRKKKH